MLMKRLVNNSNTKRDVSVPGSDPPDLEFSHTAPRRDGQFKSLTETAAAAKEKRSGSGVRERQESAVEDYRCAFNLPMAI